MKFRICEVVNDDPYNSFFFIIKIFFIESFLKWNENCFNVVTKDKDTNFISSFINQQYFETGDILKHCVCSFWEPALTLASGLRWALHWQSSGTCRIVHRQEMNAPPEYKTNMFKRGTRCAEALGQLRGNSWTAFCSTRSSGQSRRTLALIHPIPQFITAAS